MQQQAHTPNPDTLLDELTAVLQSLLQEHIALLDVAARQRQAVASADTLNIGAATEAQQHAAARISALEERRKRLTDALAHLAPAAPVAPPPTTLSALAEAYPQARDTLTTLANRIRDVATRLSREQRAIRIASEALAEHMQGLMKQIARKLSHAGTYGRRGSVDSPVQVTSALDLVT